MRLILFFLLAYAYPLPAQVDDLDIIAHYTFDGSTVDITGNGNHGQNHGATFIKDRFGNSVSALYLDGKSSYVEIPHTQDMNWSADDDYSISFWIRPESSVNLDTTDNDIISKWVIDDNSMAHEKTGYPFCIRLLNKRLRNRAATLYFAQYGGADPNCGGGSTIHSRAKIEKDKFINITATAHNGKQYLYVNGKLAGRKGSDVFCGSNNSAPIRIGKRGGSKHQNHYRGAFDDLIIYGRMLNAKEVKEIYDAAPKKREPLIAAVPDKQKVVDKPEIAKTERPKSITRKQSPAVNTISVTKSTVAVINEIPTVVKDRAVTIADHTLKVRGTKVDIRLYDHMMEDGDRVSINFNGDWIQEDVSLESKPTVVTLTLNPTGKNYVLIHAVSEGKRPPNTCTISSKYQGEHQRIKIMSDLNTSQLIELEIQK